MEEETESESPSRMQPKAVSRRRGKRWGFTLPELFVSLAIAGVSLGLLLPAIQRAREAARNAQDRSDLRQVGLVLEHFNSVHNYVPNNAVAEQPAPNVGGYREALAKAFLPYMEGMTITQGYNKDEWYFSPTNDALVQNGGLSILQLSSFPGSSNAAGSIDVGFIAGPNSQPIHYDTLQPWTNQNAWQEFIRGATVTTDDQGLFKNDERPHKYVGPEYHNTMSSITDGLSNTAIIGVNGGTAKEVSDPSIKNSFVNPAVQLISGAIVNERKVRSANESELRGIGMRKDGTTILVFADGHVENIDIQNMDKKTLNAILSKNGGEVSPSR